MPNSYTANLNMTKPEVGADTDAWGGHLNDDLDTLDAIFKSDGTGTSVGMKVGSGKTLAVAGTLDSSGNVSFSGAVTASGALMATGSVTATAATVALGASNTSIKDPSDPTKVLKFSASGITTGTTRTLTAPDENGTIALTSNTSFLPTGTVLPYAGSSAPSGYLLCYGQAVSRTTYAALFAVIGTAFGAGDTSTTFNLPDLRGRIAAGLDNMGGSAANRLTNATMSPGGTTLGATGGSEQVTLSAAEMPSHTHSVTDPTHTHGISQSGFTGNNSGLGGTGGGSSLWQTATAATSTQAASTGISIQNTGGGGAHLNVQPSIALNYIIRT